METILNIQNLYKHYEGIVAVDHANLSVTPATITGIYGDNGAGKTTLFNLIIGIEKPDNGKIIFDEYDITDANVIKRAKLGMGRLFQTPRVFGDVTVLDNLLAAGNNHEAKYMHNYILKYSTIRKNIIQDAQKAEKILVQFRLREKASLKAYELSVGEKKLLSLGCLLMNGAKFLLLDEPLAGINETMIALIKNILITIKSCGITMLIIEHDQSSLFEIADAIYEMEQGKLTNMNKADYATC